MKNYLGIDNMVIQRKLMCRHCVTGVGGWGGWVGDVFSVL